MHGHLCESDAFDYSQWMLVNSATTAKPSGPWFEGKPDLSSMPGKRQRPFSRYVVSTARLLAVVDPSLVTDRTFHSETSAARLQNDPS